jgi:hypothetical protein
MLVVLLIDATRNFSQLYQTSKELLNRYTELGDFSVIV